jgi:hypothetical protein
MVGGWAGFINTLHGNEKSGDYAVSLAASATVASLFAG